MFCTNCGKKLNQGEIFCANCGKKVQIQNTQVNSVINNAINQNIVEHTNVNNHPLDSIINEQNSFIQYNNDISQSQNISIKTANVRDINKLNNKDNKAKLIGGLIMTGIGIFLTIVTFFFFGPFLGFMYLIPGTILLFSAILHKVNKWLKILLVILMSIVTWMLVIYLSIFVLDREINKGNNGNDENRIKENSPQIETIQKGKQVGSDDLVI